MADSNAESSADNFTLRLFGHNVVCNRFQYPLVEHKFIPLEQEQPVSKPAGPILEVQPSAVHDDPAAEAEGVTAAVVVEQEEEERRAQRKKRQRLTAEQWGRMLEYANRVGWSVKKSDEARLMELCGEIGVSRQSCVNWIYNHRKNFNG